MERSAGIEEITQLRKRVVEEEEQKKAEEEKKKAEDEKQKKELEEMLKRELEEAEQLEKAEKEKQDRVTSEKSIELREMTGMFDCADMWKIGIRCLKVRICSAHFIDRS